MTLCRCDTLRHVGDSRNMSHGHIVGCLCDRQRQGALALSHVASSDALGFLFIRDAPVMTVTADHERVLPPWGRSGGARSPDISACEEI
jgi:hypothetical protein